MTSREREKWRDKKREKEKTSHGGLELSIVRVVSLRRDKRAPAASRGGPHRARPSNLKIVLAIFQCQRRQVPRAPRVPLVVRPGTDTATTLRRINPAGHRVRSLRWKHDSVAIKGPRYKLKQISRVIIINPRIVH